MLGWIVAVFTKLFSFIGSIYNSLACIISWLLTLLYKRLRRGRLRRVLSFKRGAKSCFVSIPKFKTTILQKERDASLYDEIVLLLQLNSLLTGAGISIKTGVNEVDVVCDEIQIGGPVSNKFTNRYFRRYLKNIVWIITPEHLEQYYADPNLKGLDYSFIKVSKAKATKEGFQFGGKFYPYVPGKKGLAVLIKIIDKSGTTPRTIHLLFGAGENGTAGAVTYFINHYADIYKIKKSSPYIGVFEVDSNGAPMEKINWLESRDYLR